MNPIVFLSIGFFVIFVVEIRSDEIPGFFLKVTKNVPRLGRRSDNNFENYFRKASKSVPRIGRRNGYVDSDMPEQSSNLWYDRLLNPAKRSVINSMGYYGYNLVQPMDSNTFMELLARDLFPSDQLKFIPWKDFDNALQKNQDLYTQIVSLGKDPLLQLKDDLNLKNFVPVYNGGLNNDLFYYKTIQNDRKSNDDKELIDYQT